MSKDRPFIESRLDNDFYEFPMGQTIFHRHPKTPVELRFINRTTMVRLGDMIDLGELREHLEAYQTLAFTPGELHYLMGTYEYDRPMFSLDYINFLGRLKKLPDFKIYKKDGQLEMRFYGPASEVMYWEVPSMVIAKGLYLKALMKGYSRFDRDAVEANGRVLLADKIKRLKKNKDITFSDFGTRRRFSFEHQDYNVGVLKEELPDQFKGTSNVFLAKKYEVMPIGTNSHKMPMIYSGIHWDIDNIDPTFSQRMVLKDWEEEFGLALSIFLPDTWNSDWFFKNVVTPKQLLEWKGPRQDSGVPTQFASKRIQEYKEIGVNPMTKTLICADNLDVGKMENITLWVKDKIKCTFGWGTNLMDDMGSGFLPISIVTKVHRSNGHLVGKVSDNVAKATGSPSAINRILRLTGVKNEYNEACSS